MYRFQIRLVKIFDSGFDIHINNRLDASQNNLDFATCIISFLNFFQKRCNKSFGKEHKNPPSEEINHLSEGINR